MSDLQDTGWADIEAVMRRPKGDRSARTLHVRNYQPDAQGNAGPLGDACKLLTLDGLERAIEQIRVAVSSAHHEAHQDLLQRIEVILERLDALFNVCRGHDDPPALPDDNTGEAQPAHRMNAGGK